MYSAILAGIPRPLAIRIDLELFRTLVRTGWKLTIVPSPKKDVSIKVDLLRRRLEERFRESPNVLCFKPAHKTQIEALISNVRPYFRFVWLTQAWLSLIPDQLDVFIANINGVLVTEEYWINVLRPADENSPLMLPESSFLARNDVQIMWDSASRAADIGRIAATAETIDRFREHHYCDAGQGPRSWVDFQGRIFGHRGPRHGKAPFPRCCKYSFPIPDGFHFDVTSSHPGDFTLNDWRGTRHTGINGRHINIDSHGYVI